MAKKTEDRIEGELALTDTEIKIIYDFVDSGNRKLSYRKFITIPATDYQIYTWYKRKEVNEFIKSIGSDLEIFDTVCDKKLLNIINDTQSNDRDKIAAIKVWNDLRKRTFLQVKIDEVNSLDFTDMSDDNLALLVSKIVAK